MRSNVAYETAYSIVASVALPFVLLKPLLNRKWRARLSDRFGSGGWNNYRRNQKECRVWVHAASVGEVGGIAPLVRTVQKAWPEVEIVFSTTSHTGMEEARKLGLCENPVLFPIDHPLIVSRVLSAIDPQLFLVAETELWPGVILALARRGVPTVTVNGRISDYSFPRYRALRFLFAPIVRAFSRILVQTELDRTRYLALGAAESCVEVVGCTKYDRDRAEFTKEELAKFAGELGLRLDSPRFVAASVRPGEDKEVVEAYLSARREIPNLQLVIAPRHPECFNDVAALLSDANIVFNRRSAGPAKQEELVLLLDTLGELQRVFALSTVSFVGGTLVNIGGHNPLEPAAYAVPVIVGPFTNNVRDAIAALRRERGMFQVKDGGELVTVLVDLLRDETKCRDMGRAAYEVWRKNQGATELVTEVVRRYLPHEIAIQEERRRAAL